MAAQDNATKARLYQYQELLKKYQSDFLPEDKNKFDVENISNTADCVFGPVLNTYIVWVLQEAVRNKIERLYFLARDGYFMYHAAMIYVRRFQLPIELRYVSCSRYSLRIPMFHMDTESALEYICRDSIDVSLKRILNRAGLDREEQQSVLEYTGMLGREDEHIPHTSLEQVKSVLRQCGVFMEAMLRHSRQEYPLLAGYLKQEGMLEEARDAIVDSGWVGSMQKTLNQILEKLGRKSRLEGYYWGLYELPQDVVREEYHCYYFTPEGQLKEKVYFNNNLFETIFTAPHGMTLRYQKTTEGCVPVYDSILPVKQRRIESTGKKMLSYVKNMADKMTSLNEMDCAGEKKTIMQLLKLFMSSPTREEAELYGSMTFCDDVLEYGTRQLAPRMSEQELSDNHLANKILVMCGIRKSNIKESAWYEGSVFRCSKRPGYHLLQYHMYRYLLYIRQMYIWRKNNDQKKKESYDRG